MSNAPALFIALLDAIPAEDAASFVAQAGERGRITSRAGSVDVGSTALTVAAIDAMNATIFPPAQLEGLQQTGLAEFEFVLPGIDGTFMALAGASSGDRWLDIRRRITATPARIRPAAAAPAISSLAATAPQAAGGSDDLADLEGLDFPPRRSDPGLGGLTVPDDIFERPADDSLTGLWAEDVNEDAPPAIVAADQAPVQTVRGPRWPVRRSFRVALPAAVCLIAALLVARHRGATWLPFAAETAASQPSQAPAPAIAPPPASPAPQPQTSTAATLPATPPTETAASSAPPTQTAASSAPATKTAAPSAPATKTAAASAPAAQTVRSDAPPRAGFSVQVAAVRTRDEADRLVTRFMTQGYAAYVVRGPGAAAALYRVRIGAFPDRQSAEVVAKKLEGTEGIKPWITKEVPENKTAASPQSLPEDLSSRR
jgi:cell division septation protein DedD